MSKHTFRVDSIKGGISSEYFSEGSGYLASIGIDPELSFDIPAANSSAVKSSGAIMPSSYTRFDGGTHSTYTGAPYWMSAQNKTDNTYILANDGKLYSLNNTFTYRNSDENSVSFPISISSCGGNGMAYYNNFLYIFQNADVAVYGPLDNASSNLAETETIWSGANKAGSAGRYPGFNMASANALTNYAYPALQGGVMPNHPAHVHQGDLYFGDSLNSANSAWKANQGIINRITTKTTTCEGDTDDGSAYNVLSLPYGYFPTAIESYGSDLIIAAICAPIVGNSAAINYGKAALFLWDTYSNGWYQAIYLSDPIISALKNVNGSVYVFSGNTQSGCRVSVYSGGQSVSQVAYLDEGMPPLAGDIDSFGDKVYFGGFTTYPARSASVFSLGSKFADQRFALHNVIRTASAGTSPAVTMVKNIQQANFSYPRFIVGWRDGSVSGATDQFSNGSGTFNSVFRTEVFKTEGRFVINKIFIPLTKAVDSGTSITVKVYVDTETTSFTLDTINDTNFSGLKNILYKNPKMDNTNPVTGYNNFFLEFTFTGSTVNGILFPIKIDTEIFDDEKTRP